MHRKKHYSLSALALLCTVTIFAGCNNTASENKSLPPKLDISASSSLASSSESSSSASSSESSSSASSSESSSSASSSESSSSASSSESSSSASSSESSSSASSSESSSSASSSENSSSASSSESSSSTTSSEPQSSSSSSTYSAPILTQEREPHIEVVEKPALEVPANASIEVPSLSDALSRFSEISAKEPEGTPEEIVQTLLERNVLCFAVMQAKCWTYDPKYESDRHYMIGTAPIESDYIKNERQIDDLFFGTYTDEKTNYLIHYNDGIQIVDLFTDGNDGLIVDFSSLSVVSENSFSDTTYAAVISSSEDEIVFGRYNSPTPTQDGKHPNNYHFKAVKEDGKWVLENYIVDAPAYEQQYTKLLTTKRVGAPDIVKIAKQEAGNFGGEPYWGWYGFNYRIEWCAAFVSWCYYQAGQNGPYFVACNSEGIAWFKRVGQWAEADYRDIAPGDSIFFDWDLNGSANHVGLVIGTDGEKVYTIEGNRSDSCQVLSYDLDDDRIFGYGLMKWE